MISPPCKTCIHFIGCDVADLNSLLKFVTGLSTVPPMGLACPVELCYLQQDDKLILPKAQVCFSKLYLPTVHKTQDEFNQAFLKALQFGVGYGNA